VAHLVARCIRSTCRNRIIIRFIFVPHTTEKLRVVGPSRPCKCNLDQLTGDAHGRHRIMDRGGGFEPFESILGSASVAKEDGNAEARFSTSSESIRSQSRLISALATVWSTPAVTNSAYFGRVRPGMSSWSQSNLYTYMPVQSPWLFP
jgi:hypothetical protein